MKFYRWLLVGIMVVAGAGIANADGGGVDPTVKITVPADPSCTDPNTVCFSTNSSSDPVIVMGGAALPFDITTDFIYTCDYTGSGCTDTADLPTLDTLYLAIDPTILGDIYSCNLTSEMDEAFNQCNPGGIFLNPNGDYDYFLQLACVTSDSLPSCTGMLAGEAGSAEVAPEPSDLVLLGIGIMMLGLFGSRRRKVLFQSQITPDRLAAISN
jgi:hypothetical protein